jgi:hypothetical protein
MSTFQIIVTRLLKHVVKGRCNDLELKRDNWMFSTMDDAISLSGAPRMFGTFWCCTRSCVLLEVGWMRR